MSYTVVKITTYYKAFLSDYYDRHPEVKDWTYSAQYDHLMAQAFGLADYYSKHFREIGVESYEIFANVTPMQEAWAKENGIAGNATQIVEAQLLKYKPQVIIFEHATFFSSDWIASLRHTLPSLKLMFGYCCSPFTPDQYLQFKVFDAVIICSELFRNYFNNIGIKSIELQHAFEPSILNLIEKDNQFPKSDFIFIGSIWSGEGYHTQRSIIMDQLFNLNIKPEFYGNIEYTQPLLLYAKQLVWLFANLLKKNGFHSYAKDIPLLRKAIEINSLPRNPKISKLLRNYIKHPVYGLNMYKALSKSKIGLNIHADIASGYAANMRMFEVTGVGSCLLTDWKPNLNNFFDIENEIVTYKSTDECIAKVKWLIENPNDRNRIAENGQKRVLSQHNYSNRVNKLNDFILMQL